MVACAIYRVLPCCGGVADCEAKEGNRKVNRIEPVERDNGRPRVYSKVAGTTFGEKLAAQTWFNDLLRIVGHPDIIDIDDRARFTFEKFVPGGFADAYITPSTGERLLQPSMPPLYETHRACGDLFVGAETGQMLNGIIPVSEAVDSLGPRFSSVTEDEDSPDLADSETI